jgi:hypothetical protein
MPNYVLLVLVPDETPALRLLGKAHQRYAGLTNQREG